MDQKLETLSPAWLRRYPGLLGITAMAGLIIIAVVLAGATLRASDQRDEAARWSLHTVEVQLETQRLLSDLQDAETGQRGFVLTGDPAYLEPFSRGTGAWSGHFQALRKMTADNPSQQRRLTALVGLIDLRLGHLTQGISVMRSGDHSGAIALVRQGQGKMAMDSIRALLSDVNGEEARLLDGRQTTAARETASARLMLGLLLVLVAGLVVAGGLAAAETLRARRRAREITNRAEIAEAVKAQLEESVARALEGQREAEGQLRQAQKMEAIGQLTGGIAHDFNNMLAIIIGSLDLAERRLARGTTDIRACLDNAMDGARRAAILTQRLLAFSRQQPLAPTTLDANTLVSGMSALLRQTLGEQVRLETVLAGGLWRTKADAHQLESAVVNLAVNARDAMEGGGRLTIETANGHLDDAYAAAHPEVRAGQYVVIAVTDTGHGMSDETITKAFEPFFTTKGVGKGTGLGLSQVFGFVKQSGGHVKIYSEVGRGTTIKVYLPRAFGEEEAQTAQRDQNAPMSEGRTSEIILVVEDEARVRRMSVDTLRDLGYTVRHASDGDAALKLLETLPSVRLLFTDIVMPGMTGRQLADAAQARDPDLKVLYTTGYTRNAVVHDGTIDPGVSFLAKPFTIAQLASKVRQVIDQSAA